MVEQSSDGLWQIVTWMALDGLLLWQMLWLLPKDDPLEVRMLKLLYKHDASAKSSLHRSA